MRRLPGIVVVLIVCLPMTGLASGTEREVRDDFAEVSYTGSDGNHPWAGPWQEAGENDGAAEGQIQVQDSNCSNNRCLQMKGGPLSEVQIRRAADLSGVTGATLSFDLARSHAGLVSTGILIVEARGNGSAWRTLKSYVLLTTSPSSSPSFDVGHLAGPDFQIRFRLSGLLAGDVVFIDRVEVRGQVAEGTTTTTSTTSTTISTTSTSTTSTTLPKSTRSPTTTTPTTTSSSTPDGEETVSTDSDDHLDDAGSADELEVTTTTVPEAPDHAEGVSAAGGGEPPLPGGLRAPAIGLMADYRPGSLGDGDMGRVEVLGAELEADFELAVETIETARIWLAVLSLLIAAAVVSGMERVPQRRRET